MRVGGGSRAGVLLMDIGIQSAAGGWRSGAAGKRFPGYAALPLDINVAFKVFDGLTRYQDPIP
jgi:hypothetical protein